MEFDGVGAVGRVLLAGDAGRARPAGVGAGALLAVRVRVAGHVVLADVDGEQRHAAGQHQRAAHVVRRLRTVRRAQIT